MKNLEARILDSRGAPVVLGAELGRGGEGVVRAVLGPRGLAAKLYVQPPNPGRDRARAEKLAAMVAMANERLLTLAAWPLGTLHDERGRTLGFTMPLIVGHRPVFQVYGPKLRLQQFPKADWRFLVHAAGNTARAFGAVHACGHVVGDVNHGNLLVAQDATVRFIDTDSFQIVQGARRWLCEMGVATHQPPEMQGVDSYRGVPRTPNHDAFGLAVIVFQLLCMGRHPFSGRFIGPGEPPDIEHAIAQSRYAYSRDQGRTRMIPGPDTLPIEALGETLGGMFEAAFAPAAARGQRPGAEHWAAALHEFGRDLRRCDASPSHWHAASGACPWCRLEARGATFFPIAFVPGQGGETIALLWQEIAGLPEPPEPPPPPPPARRGAAPSAASQAARAKTWGRRLVVAAGAVAGALAVLALASPDQQALGFAAVGAGSATFWFLPRPAGRREAAGRLRQARAAWAELERDWQSLSAVAAFRALRETLAAARRDHDALPQERERRLARLTTDRRGSQHQHHLESFSLARAHIAGIGKSKIATLLSYGIDSAADIEAARIAAIPGFGPKTVANLVAFRQDCDASFRFDPKRGVAGAEIAAMDTELGMRRLQLQAALRSGLGRLRAMLEDGQSRREILERRAAELRPLLAQAMADARAMGA